MADGPSSSVLLMEMRRLQKMANKHAEDFDVLGNWSRNKATELSRAINQHVNDAATQMINGRYRGDDVVHFLNPTTGLNVVSDLAGYLQTGWKLSAEQLQGVLTTGRLF